MPFSSRRPGKDLEMPAQLSVIGRGHGMVIVPPKGHNTNIVIDGSGTFIQTQLQVSDISIVGKEDPHCQTCTYTILYPSQI